MTLEDTLLSIEKTMKALLQIAQTFNSASAELGKAEFAATATTTKARGKKTDVAAATTKLLAGDPEGTRYFLIEKHNTVARVAPGETVPSIEGTVEVDSDVYTAKKAEFAKKSVTATPTTSPAATSAGTADASTASSGEAVKFQQVVDQLMVLSRDTRPGKGRDGVMAFIAKHGVAKVPLLEGLGKNAELLAEVNALLAPDAAPVEVDPFA